MRTRVYNYLLMYLRLVVPTAAKLTVVVSEPLIHSGMRAGNRNTRYLGLFHGVVAEILSVVDSLILRGSARGRDLTNVGRPITVVILGVRGVKNIEVFDSAALEERHVGQGKGSCADLIRVVRVVETAAVIRGINARVNLQSWCS